MSNFFQPNSAGDSGTSFGINYIDNPDAESNTSGWATYADAAQASPVNGTGGSPVVTWTRSTTTPLRGTADFNFTKDAANRQGEGVSYDFTIDNADQATVLGITFDYDIVSGTYSGGTPSTDSDLTVWIYDVTNAVVIQPATYKISGAVSGVDYHFKSTFQTASNSTSYRLIIHCSTTSASAYTLGFDNFVVGPQQSANVPPLTDWISYTPTYTGFGSPTTNYMEYRRVGSNMEIRGRFDAGTPTGVEARLSLPFGTVASSITSNGHGGTWFRNNNGAATTSHGGNLIILAGETYIKFSESSVFGNGSVNPLAPALGNSMSSAGDDIVIYALVPIAGWGSSLTLLGSDAARVVACRVGGDPASASSGNPVIFPSVAYDTHSAYNSSTGRYTTPISGFFRVHGYITSANTGVTVSVFVNAVSIISVGATDSNGECAYSGTVQVNSGDIIDIRPNNTLDAASGSTVHFERIAGPESISASETVGFRAVSTSGSALPTSDGTIFVYGTETFDTHGAYNSGTGVFTAPIAGIYKCDASIGSQTGTYAVGNLLKCAIYVNGSVYQEGFFRIQTTNSTTYSASASALVRLNAGDTVDVRPTKSGTAVNSSTSASENNFSCFKIGG